MSIHEKILAAQDEFPALEKTAKAHYGKYTPLDTLLPAVEPHLHKRKVILVSRVVPIDSAFALVTAAIDTETGDSVESSFPLPATGDPQEIGSAMTYGRRYNIVALLNLRTESDDDGQHASRGRSGGGSKGGKRGGFWGWLDDELGDGKPWEHPKVDVIKALFGTTKMDEVKATLAEVKDDPDFRANCKAKMAEVKATLASADTTSEPPDDGAIPF
jgi:hypothetical protein